MKGEKRMQGASGWEGKQWTGVELQEVGTSRQTDRDRDREKGSERGKKERRPMRVYTNAGRGGAARKRLARKQGKAEQEESARRKGTGRGRGSGWEWRTKRPVGEEDDESRFTAGVGCSAEIGNEAWALPAWAAQGGAGKPAGGRPNCIHCQARLSMDVSPDR
jgi:hypothetical protein